MEINRLSAAGASAWAASSRASTSLANVAGSGRGGNPRRRRSAMISRAASGIVAWPMRASSASTFFFDVIDLGVKVTSGRCSACLDICPTAAFVGPYVLDARRCISYLTIEHAGPIPHEFRESIGNRIYGCDDCQLCCPWNRFAQLGDPAFSPRHGLDSARLSALFAWTEAEFNERLAGNPIRRIGHERWLRNIAVALGNAPNSPEIQAALGSRANHPSPLVREHVVWALARLAATSSAPAPRA